MSGVSHPPTVVTTCVNLLLLVNIYNKQLTVTSEACATVFVIETGLFLMLLEMNYINKKLCLSDITSQHHKFLFCGMWKRE